MLALSRAGVLSVVCSDLAHPVLPSLPLPRTHSNRDPNLLSLVYCHTGRRNQSSDDIQHAAGITACSHSISTCVRIYQTGSSGSRDLSNSSRCVNYEAVGRTFRPRHPRGTCRKIWRRFHRLHCCLFGSHPCVPPSSTQQERDASPVRKVHRSSFDVRASEVVVRDRCYRVADSRLPDSHSPSMLSHL